MFGHLAVEGHSEMAVYIIGISDKTKDMEISFLPLELDYVSGHLLRDLLQVSVDMSIILLTA